MAQLSFETKVCARCGERQSVDNFYFVSKKLGTRRGQCKACMSDLKKMQKEPGWKPACSRCGKTMTRFGPGRRLCVDCFAATHDTETRLPNGSYRAPLNPCSACGVARLRADHVHGGTLCGICRAVGQSRRKRLRLYNLSPRNYMEMLEDQGYCCWICRRQFDRARVPHVDHQHAEPRIVRGLLCASCNTILALARDNPDRLRSAAKFLETPPAQDLYPGLVALPEANRGDYRPLKRVWAPKEER